MASKILVNAMILISAVLTTSRGITTGLTPILFKGIAPKVITGMSGVVMSPNYPDAYENNANYVWIFETIPGNRIKLVFEIFEVELHPNCPYDSVTIYDGHMEKDPILGTLCGYEIPPPIISTSNTMTMLFHSDHSQPRRGFKASFTSETGIRSISGVNDTKTDLRDYYIRTVRHPIRLTNKWGTHTSRAAVALFLSEPQFFAPGVQIGEELAYQLSLELLSKLTVKKKISTNDLALFINALTVVCIDPKDFFGVNAVYELRKRVTNNNYTNPFYILTLCNARDAMTKDDVLKLQKQYDAHLRPMWTDTQAMVIMALSCISSHSNVSLDERILDEMVSELRRKQYKNGTIENLMNTALVVQALLAAENYRSDFDLHAAIKAILQEINRTRPSIEEIFYILPIFNSMSLANMSSDHCETHVKTDLGVKSKSSGHADERIRVQVSVVIGNDMDFSRTWKVKVFSNDSLYQVLESIGTMEHAYKVHYSVSEGKPYVVRLAKFQDDIKVGFFWFIYTKPFSSAGRRKLLEESPIDIQVKENEELILWYRSGSWETAHDDSSK